MGSNTQSTLAIDGSLATVTISTVDGLNVMSTKTVTQLGEVIDQVASHPQIRFTVLQAEGKVFVAGADIKEMSSFDPAAARSFGQLGTAVCNAIEALPSITVAAIQGAALGGGCELALACDFRIATTKVKIGLPETTLGLIPGWGGIPRAAKLLGPPAAKRLVFGGTPLDAKKARQMGLIDEVVPDSAALDEAVAKLRASLMKGSPAAIALVKRALRDGEDVAAFAACFTGPESREGMAAFVEKRAANWAAG